MTHRIDKTFSKWRAGYTSGEQCCASAYNMLVKKDKQIEELKKEIECLNSLNQETKRNV